MSELRPQRLNVEQFHEIARALRARSAPDAKTAAAVAAALDSVALQRAERMARAQRMQADFRRMFAFRKVAQWAVTRF